MKQLFLLAVLFFFSGLALTAQQQSALPEGVVSFITSQNVYVKFRTTESLAAGDTLFIMQESLLQPALIIKELSSISCVCISITSTPFLVGSTLFGKPKTTTQTNEVELVTEKKAIQVTGPSDSLKTNKEGSNPPKQTIHGRVSLASYTHLSNESETSQRMRYTLSLNAQNIGNSKFSTETYLTFAHKAKEWNEIQDNISNGLKIYSLAVNYQHNKNNTLWFGRKINPRLSSVGAIDGMQYENTFKAFTLGAFAGCRPDTYDYGFNAQLFQYGGYFGHDFKASWGNMQSSLAFVEQQNGGNTDRRFVYMQHTNSLLKKLYFFGSAEFDLFNKTLNTQDSSLVQDYSPKLSNLYLSLRYKVTKQLSLTASYSARENIVYYETYKNIIDQLLEASSLKGYAVHVTYNPWNAVSIGVNAGYRATGQDHTASKNLNGYVTYNNVPWINAVLTLTSTWMQTSYINGSIYSFGLSRDVVPGKLYAAMNYRFVDYKFANEETPLIQNMAELNMTWRIMKKLSCSLNVEGTFEKNRNYERIYFSITQRF
jgi:hypothetical protein